MGEPAKRKATYQDVLNSPETVIAEIIDGELHTSPRPGPIHANAASVLGGQLVGPFHRKGNGDGAPGGWWILDEPEIHLGDDIVVPDLAGWRRVRMTRLPEEAYFSMAPDWVCEILSPWTARMDRVKKKRLYARNQVRCMWLIDPAARTLEVLRLAGEFWLEIASHGGDERVRVEPFESLEIDISRWWGEE